MGNGCCTSPIRPNPISWRRCGRGRPWPPPPAQPPPLDDQALRNLTAAYELIARAGLTHTRPPFGIRSVSVGNREVEVREEAAHATPFGTLLHFKKDIAPAQPRVLLVAPLSGHFATLLRATVRTMLPEHDVFITDWHNARDVPLTAGRFGVDEYVEHLIKFLEVDGAGLACARGVPALRRRALRRGGDGAGRQSGAAALDDADGRADRYAASIRPRSTSSPTSARSNGSSGC